MTTTLKFLAALTTTTTTMQIAATITLGLLDADLPVRCPEDLQSRLDDCRLSNLTNSLEGLDTSFREDLEQIYQAFTGRLQKIFNKFAKAANSKRNRETNLHDTELKCKRKVSASLNRSLFTANVVTEGHLISVLRCRK